MCGIVGLFIKNAKLESRLGELLSPMLVEMSERGPDSAGVAFYRNPVAAGSSKVTLLNHDLNTSWQNISSQLKEEFGNSTSIEIRFNHAVVVTSSDANTVLTWLSENFPNLHVTSSGTTIEIYKDKGIPSDVIDRFDLATLQGTHALGHTRMATESAVTTEHSHPFSTGLDLCLVHNGSLSNHNCLRRKLQKEGIEFKTDNDSEVAAGYLMWRIREGDSLSEALENAIEDLDGFYTFVVGTRDGFAVLRDPIGCKPAIMAETDDWAAMASEFCSIANLPSVENAKIWEPEPEKIYSWARK